MERESWLLSCKKTIQEFVENSTRLTPDKIDLSLQEYIDFDFQILLELDIRVKEKSDSQSGYVTNTANRLVFTNVAQYQEALKAETSAVLSRRENLREARSLVLSCSYGDVRQETIIYAHPRHVCLTENCYHCNGRGRVNCSGCGGSGKTTCYGCSGSGQVMEQRSYYDNYTKQNRYENYYRSCSSCNGGGKVNCSSCGGAGDQRCESCSGTGKITKITQLYSVAVPDYQPVYFREDVQQFIKDGLNKAGLPKLKQFGTIEIKTADINDVSNSVRFIFSANIPFARFNSPLPQTQSDELQIPWIIYGESPFILDSGHVIELMLKSDLNNLVYSATTSKLLNPFLAVCSRQAVQTFMESEAHQSMVDANRSGKSGEMLRETLNRGFTTTYLEEALTSLEKIMTVIQRWSVVKWAVFSSILIYLLMPFYTGYANAWYPNLETGKIYLTPFTRWDNQQYVLQSLQILTRLCGLFIVVMAVLLPGLGYAWRRCWVKWRLGEHLCSWSLHKRILKNRWLLSLSGTVMLTTLLLSIFPIWVSQNGMLFDVIPFYSQSLWVRDFLSRFFFK